MTQATAESTTTCWCCGEPRSETELVRLLCHDEVALCGVCVGWLGDRLAQGQRAPVSPPPVDDGTVLMSADDPIAVEAGAAIQAGDVDALKRLLDANPTLATARIGDQRMSRTLLHAATDWPGHFPDGAAIVAALVEAGADVNARFAGPHEETALHWAASSDDVEVLDALLDAGANIEAPGAVLGGGSPLVDAVGFAQWEAARRLVERGAKTRLGDAAALGMLGRVEEYFAAKPHPTPQEVTGAFWKACHGGQRLTAEYLLDRGADLNWAADWDGLTPLDTARRNGADRHMVDWLRSQGARSADELT